MPTIQDKAKLKNKGIKLDNILNVHFDMSIEGTAQIKAKIKYLKLKKLSFNFLFSIKIFKKLAPPRHVIIPYTRERMPKKFVRNKIEKRSKIAPIK